MATLNDSFGFNDQGFLVPKKNTKYKIQFVVPKVVTVSGTINPRLAKLSIVQIALGIIFYIYPDDPRYYK